jgi:ATP-dependent Clp protease ATP-binding subunit ClpB
MDPSHLTQKSQEALRDAQTKALRFGHQEVDGEHLLLALLDQPEGIAPRLLSQTGADPGRLRKELEAELSRRPRVTGPGVQPGQVTITQRLARLLDTAQQSADRLKDEYVSVEHLLLALISEGPTTAAGRLLHDEGVTRDRFLEALTKIRGNQRVTSAMPESAYEALIKYGTDLVAEAWARRPSWRVWPSGSTAETYPRDCGTRRSSAWTWGPWWPGPSTAASSRNGFRPS